MVNSSMDKITVYAWLEDASGKILNSDYNHTIDFIHLDTPVTSLGNEKVEFPKDTVYTIIYGHKSDPNVVLYGYPDGEFKPAQNLTRAEFASLIAKFTKTTEFTSR